MTAGRPGADAGLGTDQRPTPNTDVVEDFTRMTPDEDWIPHYEAADERDRLTAAPGGRLEFIGT